MHKSGAARNGAPVVSPAKGQLAKGPCGVGWLRAARACPWPVRRAPGYVASTGSLLCQRILTFSLMISVI